MNQDRKVVFGIMFAWILLVCGSFAFAVEGVIRSAASGPWSESATWEGNHVPAAGARILICPGHIVTYDVSSDAAIRAIQIGGTLTFARDRDTLLNVGLLRIAPGDQYSEEGFECDAHLPKAAMPISRGRPSKSARQKTRSLPASTAPFD